MNECMMIDNILPLNDRQCAIKINLVYCDVQSSFLCFIPPVTSVGIAFCPPLDIKGCICHFIKWQIHPFISDVTMLKVKLRDNLIV